MNNTIFFDMDGTLAGLFFVKGYSKMLAENDTTPYEVANPLFNAERMRNAIENAKKNGYRIGIISYYGKDSNAEMIKATRKVKREWLEKYFPYADEIHIISPNTKKCSLAKKGDILFDDSTKNRNEWKKGLAINAHFRKDWMTELENLIK